MITTAEIEETTEARRERLETNRMANLTSITAADYNGTTLSRDGDTLRTQFPTMADATSWAGDYLPADDDTVIEPATSLRQPVTLLVSIAQFRKAWNA
jgi:hypothetical protein